MKKIVIILLIVALIIGGVYLINIGSSKKTNKKLIEPKKEVKEEKKEMNIIIEGVTFETILEDNDTVDGFLKMLPLDVNMTDLNDNEKYFYLDSSLPTESKNYKNISSGDIMLFGDNCLVLFYLDHTSYYDYTKIGKVVKKDEFANLLKRTSSKIRFEIK